MKRKLSGAMFKGAFALIIAASFLVSADNFINVNAEESPLTATPSVTENAETPETPEDAGNPAEEPETQTEQEETDSPAEPEDEIPACLSFSDSVYSLKQGETKNLAGLLFRPEGSPEKVTWKTSNRYVASVSSNGVVTGVAAGTVKITAVCGTETASCDVKILPAFKLNRTSYSFTRTNLKPAPTVWISATKPKGVKKVVWKSSNPGVAKVDAKGKVTAVGAGTAKITCTDPDGNYESMPCTVSVADFIICTDSAHILNKKIYVLAGQSFRLDIANTKNKQVKWSSSNSRIATIGADGTVTGVKKGVITATALATDKTRDRVSVTIVQPTETLSINCPGTFYVGQTFKFKATLSRNSNDPVLWSVSDKGIATIDTNGKLKGLAQGTVTVTATTFSGKSVSRTFTVRSKAKTLAWSQMTPYVKAGETVTEAVVITSPENCNDTITWTVSNKKLGSVRKLDAQGTRAEVTGLGKGTFTLTAKSGSGKTIKTSFTVINEPAQKIQIKTKYNLVRTGWSTQLKTTVSPATSNDVVLWKSSDTAVATVDKSGRVSGVSVGSATITAYSALNGEVTGTTLVSVKRKLSTTRVEWGFGPGKDSLNRPTSCITAQKKYSEFNTHVIDLSGEKVIYLTYNLGWEKGHTDKTLDVLKEKNVKATFFVIGDYAKTNNRIVNRIIDEGHVLGSHTWSHADLSRISASSCYNELYNLHEYVKTNYNYEMKVMRPSCCYFNEEALAVSKDFGYDTYLWSYAYADWVTNPLDKKTVLNKLRNNLHPGAIYQLHTTGPTNSDVLGDFIDYARSQGYTFVVPE